MILKVIREEENEKIKRLRTEYYSGKSVVLVADNDINNSQQNIEIDGKPIILEDYVSVDIENNVTNSKTLNAYLMSDEGKTIERIV